MTDADARLWHTWLRINSVLRLSHTRWSAERFLIDGSDAVRGPLRFFQEHQYCGKLDGSVDGDRSG